MLPAADTTRLIMALQLPRESFALVSAFLLLAEHARQPVLDVRVLGQQRKQAAGNVPAVPVVRQTHEGHQ